jgi:hypothetical protein
VKQGVYLIEKIQHGTLLVGLAGVAACLLGAVFARQQFLISYLFAYLFWFGIAAGCLVILMIHFVTGGAWGDLIKPQLEAAGRTFPVLAVLFIPILAGVQPLFPWARPEAAADALLQHKHLYLNVPFFGLRAVFYFAVWSLMGYRLNKKMAAPGLILYALTLTLAIVDWMMSLEPRWYSTIYAALVIIGFMLTAFAFVTVGLHILQTSQDRQAPHLVKPYWDLGNMILAFVMFWAYLAFSQYLIIWSANLPEETTWYVSRQQGGWFWVGMTLIAFQFFLPFLILLNRSQKQRLDRLARIAVLLLVLGGVNVFWLVEPAFSPGHFHIHGLDLAAFVAVGGVWLSMFLARLRQRPALVGSYVPEEAA